MIKKGLNVKILTGKDKNKTGEVIEVDRNNDRIKVKGIAHKIQTYQVVGSYKNIARKRKILNKKFDGFNLNIDLNISKKNKVITSLENTLKQLKKNEKSD